MSASLRMHDGRLELHRTAPPGAGAVAADWGSADLQRRIAAGFSLLLARAVGLRPDSAPRVLDATGGLGRDAFTLAALGAQVTVAERQPVVFQLLADAHRRALAQPSLAIAAARVQPVAGDARALLAQGWDAVLLDPMYPETGKTALAGKELQALRDLVGEDDDADQLLAAALPCTARVAVKRPLRAEPLAGPQPNHVLAGTQARFDVYLGSRR
ncbi:MAG TPA: class I SAM-dependent methyltransferase [Candidatus Binatia bacterium]|nr:class I SAM-dependent methyltransferase [Candidatus Binatia bacterium]